jgi:hypothetical protein
LAPELPSCPTWIDLPDLLRTANLNQNTNLLLFAYWPTCRARHGHLISGLSAFLTTLRESEPACMKENPGSHRFIPAKPKKERPRAEARNPNQKEFVK